HRAEIRRRRASQCRGLQHRGRREFGARADRPGDRAGAEMSSSELSGVVVVDKPSGPTSFDVVRRVKGLFKAKRCGHTGTLDPTATGVLPICIGDATKVASFVAEGEKEYDAVVRFGIIPDRQDGA